ncbi:MAG: hypothetical protein Q9163_001194 [Psora crenata]
MSPVIFACIVCGYAIYGYETSAEGIWLREFRASKDFEAYDKGLKLILSVYSSPEGIFISGVGRYDDPGGGTWIAPSAVRWDDQDCVFQAGDELPVMQQHPENNRHGFVLHDACWRLVQKALEPEEVPLERLLKICRSLPFPLRGISVCWGHDYGGLTAFDDQHHYPWEDRLIEQSGDSKVYQYARINPYDMPEISEPFKMRLEDPPTLFAKTQTGDCFSTLPWEILETVAINLPTGDALVLRRASRAFLPVLSSQIFWASRFQPGHEREHVFEKRNKEQRDWMSLYRRTSYAHSPPGLNNRRRIWGLIRNLIILLPLRLDDGWELPPVPSTVDGLKWIEVAGDIKRTTSSGHCEYFNEGCRLFYKQWAPIPGDLSKISFSVVAAGDGTYITGMRLITSDDADIRLGYLAEGNETFVEVTAVKGFVLAIGPRGIRAIQVIGLNKHTSKWFGCPMESPVTERLAGCESISALKVGFDGYKIISLAVAEPNLPCVSEPGAHVPYLRTTALWYPTVPSPDVCLNDESFTGECPSTAGYQPLFWTLFGGPGGIYLRFLTEVSVTRLGDLCEIEFHYDTEDITMTRRTLGRRNITEFSRTTRFYIDGPGGELIQSVDVSIKRAAGERVYRFYKHVTKTPVYAPLAGRTWTVMDRLSIQTLMARSLREGLKLQIQSQLGASAPKATGGKSLVMEARDRAELRD